MTLQEVIDYEVRTCSFGMSFIYMWFPKYFIRKCRRKLRRYNFYIQEDALIQIKKLLKQ